MDENDRKVFQGTVQSLFFFFFFLATPNTSGILVPRPGIELVPPAVKVQSLSHWNIREVQSHFFKSILLRLGLPWWLSDKEATANAWDTGGRGPIPELGRSPGEGNGNPVQYSCLGNPMDRGAWPATVHEVAQSRTQLKWRDCECICVSLNFLWRHGFYWLYSILSNIFVLNYIKLVICAAVHGVAKSQTRLSNWTDIKLISYFQAFRLFLILKSSWYIK